MFIPKIYDPGMAYVAMLTKYMFKIQCTKRKRERERVEIDANAIFGYRCYRKESGCITLIIPYSYIMWIRERELEHFLDMAIYSCGENEIQRSWPSVASSDP